MTTSRPAGPQLRPYKSSHPWLTFTLDLRNAPPRLWLLLGECVSKCDHLAGVPLRPQTATQLLRIYLARGVLASAAIEGNTLTEEEALAHVEGRLTTPPSRRYLQQELDNILRLHNEISSDVIRGESRPLTTALIKEINRRVLEGLEVDAHVTPGEIPSVDIGVGRYRGAPRPDCEHLLDRLTEWLNQDWSSPGILEPTAEAIVKAIIAHLYLAWIHPFGDGNGRTARLVETMILLRGCLPQPACQLLSNHYNRTRERYYRELQRASASGGDVMGFLIYAVEGFRDGLKEQIDIVREQQWDVAWRNYVHEQFKDGGEAMKRRRDLVLDLSRHESMPKATVAEVSPRVAAMYAKLDEKTLARDLAWLESRSLVRREGDDYLANRELILAFLPLAAPRSI